MGWLCTCRIAWWCCVPVLLRSPWLQLTPAAAAAAVASRTRSVLVTCWAPTPSGYAPRDSPARRDCRCDLDYQTGGVRYFTWTLDTFTADWYRTLREMVRHTTPYPSVTGQFISQLECGNECGKTFTEWLHNVTADAKARGLAPEGPLYYILCGCALCAVGWFPYHNALVVVMVPACSKQHQS
jgi:hypothetical protein